MKQIRYLSIFIILLLAVCGQITAQVIKTVKVGNMRLRVHDGGHQSFAIMTPFYGSFGFITMDFDNNDLPDKLFGHYTISEAGTLISCVNWKDTTGTTIPYKTSGANIYISESLYTMFAVPETNGRTMHRYMRYQPPAIVVDGKYINESFPNDDMDEVAPDKFPDGCTADIMVESAIRTNIGLDVRQRVLGWSQKNHDDYVIYDLIFKNTGNIDKDDDIDLPNNELDSLFIMRSFLKNVIESGSLREKDWTHWTSPNDPLRLVYNYHSRLKIYGAANDYLGWQFSYDQYRLNNTIYIGEATLFVSNAVNDMMNNNPAQPNMRSIWDKRMYMIADHEDYNDYFPNKADVLAGKVQSIMRDGITDWVLYSSDKGSNGTYVKPPFFPGTHIEIPTDSGMTPAGKMSGSVDYMEKIEPWGGPTARTRSQPMYSIGPFHLKRGDSIRLVYAMAAGTISKRKGMEIARQWYAGRIAGNPPCPPAPGCSWNNGSPTYDSPDRVPGTYRNYPTLYNNNENDWGKDTWVLTGRDSITQNALAAKWNFEHNYNIPIAPPPPSINVQGRWNVIRILWGSESEAATDFAGYRVYRAIGSYADSEWVKIYECTGKSIHQYDDINAIRGFTYYYAVTAFDDGISNFPDFNGQKQSLESHLYANMTTTSTNLTGIDGNEGERIPKKYSLYQNYPNPFNPSTSIHYDIPKATHVMLMVYNMLGEQIALLVDKAQSAGAYTVQWNSQTKQGMAASGIYFVTMCAGDFTKTMKVILMK